MFSTVTLMKPYFSKEYFRNLRFLKISNALHDKYEYSYADDVSHHWKKKIKDAAGGGAIAGVLDGLKGASDVDCGGICDACPPRFRWKSATAAKVGIILMVLARSCQH